MSVAAVLLIVVSVKILIGPPVPPAPPLPKDPVDLAGAILAGNPSAHVAMIEFSDFECAFCGRFTRDTEPTLWHEYVDSGQLLVAFRHLVLEERHPHALRAAEAGECANRQGQFWPMHDVLFHNQVNPTIRAWRELPVPSASTGRRLTLVWRRSDPNGFVATAVRLVG